MEIDVTDGLNIVSVGLSDIGSYFRHVLPITISWADCGGSVARYMSMMPYDPELRAELQQKILANLNNDYTGKEYELYEILKPLFRLFPNGKYRLNYTNNDNPYFLQYQTSSDNYSQTHISLWYVATPKMVRITDEEKVKKEHKEFLRTLDREKFYPNNLIDYTTDHSYAPHYFVLHATRPEAEMDADRITRFENEIKNGARPFAITISSSYAADDLDSEEFILDGHHKLAAYQKLGLPPVLARIYFNAEKDTMGFDAELLIDRLFPWQVEHILSNWDDKLYFLAEALKNPESKLHRFIKNGFYNETHENGKRKHEAFYINDKVEGVSKGWYDNGKRQYEHYFKDGKRTGTWTEWHPNGQVSYVQQFDESGRYDKELISYYDNGNIRWKQVFKNGRNVDGISHQSWYQTGVKDSDLIYKDGRMMERINYDRYGRMINHEKYDEALGKMVKLVVPPQNFHYANKYDDWQGDKKETYSHIYQKYDPADGGNNGLWGPYTWKHIVYLIIFLLWLLRLMSR